jgi:hypothetical protein
MAGEGMRGDLLARADRWHSRLTGIVCWCPDSRWWAWRLLPWATALCHALRWDAAQGVAYLRGYYTGKW